MARKTDGEKIDELVTVVAELGQRLNSVENQIKDLPDLTTRVALLEQQLRDFRDRAEEASRRRWSLLPAIVSAVLGAVLALASQAILKHFWP